MGATPVFFASLRDDGTYQLWPSDLTDPDERDLLEEHPSAEPAEANVHALGALRKMTVFKDPARAGWAWVRIADV
jgi:hypothetical protein